MDERLPQKLISYLRPSEEQLSSELKTQVQFHRLLTLLGASLIPLFGLLYDLADPAAVDPAWVRVLVSGLYAGLFATSYWAEPIRRNFVRWTWGLIYVTMGWFAALTVANRLAPDYAVGFLVLFSVLTAVVGLGARSIRPVLGFVGYGVFLTAGASFVISTHIVSPLILTASVATVATVEIAVVQGRLSTRRALRRSEETLREERNLLDRVLQTSPVAIAVFNPEGEFIEASGRAEEILGLEKEAVTDRTYNDPEWGITRPDGSPMPDEELPFARVMSTGKPVYDVEHAIEWPDGTRRLLSVSGAPLRGEEEGLEGAVFHIDDITEQRKAERALRESEQRFRGVFENAAIGIAIVDEEGRVVEANPALQDMLGHGLEELQGHHFDRFTHSEDLEADQEQFRELVEGERDRYQMEKRYVRKDGETFWGRLTVSRFEGAQQGKVVGMVEDIDEQKRYEKTLREAKEEAERMSRLKSAFLANMSHEIRTPLTSILGFAEAIGEEARSAGENDEIDLASLSRFSGLIEKSGRRLMDTLNGVLNLSKLEAGEMDLRPEPIDLAEEARETAEEFGPQAKDAGLDLTTSTPGAPVWARADEGGLHIAIRNLVGNAIKYTEPGGRVWVRAWEEEEAACLEVEDTGIGMDADKVSELCEPFKQASEGIGREYEGTGLGLTLVQRVTDEIGGTVEIETEKGEGTCFTVRLPKAGSSEEASQEG